MNIINDIIQHDIKSLRFRFFLKKERFPNI